jgi:hypothetical protein
MIDSKSYASNVTGELLTHLLRVREVPGSNLGPENGYPYWFFVLFLSPSRKMTG